MMQICDSKIWNENSGRAAVKIHFKTGASIALIWLLAVAAFSVSAYALPAAAAEEAAPSVAAPVYDTVQDPAAVAVTSAADGTGTGSATASATSAATAAAATKTLYQQVFEEKMTGCMGDKVSEEAMDYMIKHFDLIQDGLENKSIQNVVGCLALEREDPAYCDKFQTIPDSVKSLVPFEAHIESCKEKTRTFLAFKDAFSGGGCPRKMEAYCEETKICGRKSPDGKICTCQLYAAYQCGIASSNSVEQCWELRPKIEKTLSGRDRDVVDRMVKAVITLCQKAVLGANPMENERDIGSSISLFLGGLFSGADWPVYSEDANPEKFGVPQEIAYWYDYVYKHKTTCLKHLDIFREDFCRPYAAAAAREKEQEALKKMKEDEESGKGDDKQEKAGDETAKEKKNKDGKNEKVNK